MKLLNAILVLTFFALLSGCGVVTYPGQPGMVTSNYSKVDLEVLEEPGLFVYEAVYDNRKGGAGVGALVTKLYPGAQTYTSNVRTNADGTLYRVKAQYSGAEMQMISIPSLHQIHLNPNHKLSFMVDYETSLDEVDEKNIAEDGVFKPLEGVLNAAGFESKRFRWDLFRASKLLPNGNLAFEVNAVEMSGQKFAPLKPVNIETTFFQNAVRTNLTAETKAELVQFIETRFPTGYKGEVQFHVKGSQQPVTMKMGIHTFKTAEAAGYKIIKGISEKILNEYVQKQNK